MRAGRFGHGAGSALSPVLLGRTSAARATGSFHAIDVRVDNTDLASDTKL
jgi:hypothetical protein